MKATQEQYDSLAVHLQHKIFYDDWDISIEDAYYEARLILAVLGYDYRDLNEHLVDKENIK